MGRCATLKEACEYVADQAAAWYGTREDPIDLEALPEPPTTATRSGTVAPTLLKDTDLAELATAGPNLVTDLDADAKHQL